MTGASEKIMAYLTTLGITSAAELTFAQKLKLTTMALWEQAAAWAATPMGKATIAAVGIFALVKAIEYFNVSIEETKERLVELDSEMQTITDSVKSISTEFSNLRQSADEVIPRFAELAQGVNAFGENVSLTDEEYSEFLNLNNQIAEMFPELNSGMDSNGNAMLSLSFSADTLTDSLWALVEAEREAANVEIAKKLPDALAKAAEADENYERLIDDVKEQKEALAEVYADIPDLTTHRYLAGKGFDGDAMNEYNAYLRQLGVSVTTKAVGASYEGTTYEVSYDFDMSEVERNYANALAGLDSQLYNLEQQAAARWADVNPIVSAWLQTDFMYNDLDDSMQSITRTMVSGLDFSMLGCTTQEQVEDFVHSHIVEPLFSATPEVKQAFASITDWRGQIQNGEITAEQFATNVTSAFDSLFSSMNPSEVEAFKQLFVTSFNNIGIAGTDFTAVLSGVISEWSKVTPVVTDATGAINVFASVSDDLDTAKTKIDSLSEAFDKLSDGSLEVWDVIDLLQQFPELAEYVDLTADNFGNLDEGLEKLIRSTPDEFIKTMQEFKETKNLTGEAAEQIDALCEAINKLSTDKLDELSQSANDLTQSLKSIYSLSDGLDELSKIYSDVKNSEDFDWASLLDNQTFETAFSNLGDIYTDFVRTVANSSGDIKACQDAFNNLATAYVVNSEELQNVTDETRDYTIALLSQKGIANAAAVVDAQLAYSKERLAYSTGEYANATEEELYALYEECEAGTLAKQVLAELTLQKELANESAISTEADVAALIALAEAANATIPTLERLSKVRAIMAQVEEYQTQLSLAQAGNNFSAIQWYSHRISTAMESVQEILSTPIEYEKLDFGEYIVDYDGGYIANTANDSTSSSSDATNWFEEQYALHQHLMSMDRENVSDYLKWLETAYQKAYSEGIIELEDFYKYQEEVYTGLHDLFLDYLNDVEHEISMRENYDSESAKIVSLYKELIASVEQEISTARAQGLDDTDDYIQELQSKYWDYTTSVNDILDETTSNAKDALDELVEYRIDMLKQDTEDEKDALNKKLDNLKEFYDKQKELLQNQHDEEQYLEDQAEKRKVISDLQIELAMLEYDDSAWAQKRKIELQEELLDAQKDIDNFESDHALELALEALDNAYNSQESQIQAEIDALEETLNDPAALYNQALSDIKNNTGNLYQEMLDYNRKYGSGNDDDIAETYEEAYKALLAYKSIYGQNYEGVVLSNAIGYTSSGNSWDTSSISGSSSGTSSGSSVAATNQSQPNLYGNVSEISETLRYGSEGNGVRALQYALNSLGYGNAGTSSVDGSFGSGTQNAVKTFQKAMGLSQDGVVGSKTKAKFKASGYASGTMSATPGLHKIDEVGTEYIFESPSDGSRYRIFQGGEMVLNAAATKFLYNFAMSGTNALSDMMSDVASYVGLDKITMPTQSVQLSTGDIIIKGNANEQTVSEIRRSQREQVSYILKELNKLSK